LKAKVIERQGIVVDSKSGVSGAGRTAKPHLHFPECNESVAAYSIGQHRHTPEIDQLLSDAGDGAVEVVFSPHLIPMDRGILTTAYATPKGAVTEGDLIAALNDFYADEPFIRVVDQLPNTKQVLGTNYCDVTARIARGRVIVISVIDNLVKGAAGAAVQNFNLMCGVDETTAL
jgi:N-acetyl-gamma-glutamyl-phosphate reductase